MALMSNMRGEVKPLDILAHEIIEVLLHLKFFELGFVSPSGPTHLTGSQMSDFHDASGHFRTP